MRDRLAEVLPNLRAALEELKHAMEAYRGKLLKEACFRLWKASLEIEYTLFRLSLSLGENFKVEDRLARRVNPLKAMKAAGVELERAVEALEKGGLGEAYQTLWRVRELLIALQEALNV